MVKMMSIVKDYRGWATYCQKVERKNMHQHKQTCTLSSTSSERAKGQRSKLHFWVKQSAGRPPNNDQTNTLSRGPPPPRERRRSGSLRSTTVPYVSSRSPLATRRRVVSVGCQQCSHLKCSTASTAKRGAIIIIISRFLIIGPSFKNTTARLPVLYLYY